MSEAGTGDVDTVARKRIAQCGSRTISILFALSGITRDENPLLEDEQSSRVTFFGRAP
jgi:hypothetical protein